MRRVLLATLTLFLALSCAVAEEGAGAAASKAASLQAAFMQVAKEVGPAVVGVYNIQRARVLGYAGGPRGYYDMDELLRLFDIPLERRSIGSGVIIDPSGYVLSNEHVVGNADAIEVMLSDGRKFQGKVVGKDPRADMAVIKIEAAGLPAARLGDSDTVRTGQWAIAIGNPFGIFEDNPTPTVTVGVVSAVHRRLGSASVGGRYYGDLIQTDAAINPGNSGGPLINLKGEVVGINAAIISPSGAYAGIGFAIPVNRAKEVLEELKKGQEIEYGWLGVGIQTLNKDLAEEFKLPDSSGALVITIIPGSPASAAGLRVGDVIRECGGQAVRDTDGLMEKIGRTRPGKAVKLKIMRDGKEQSIDVLVGRKGERVT